jgi:hypothetical protein
MGTLALHVVGEMISENSSERSPQPFIDRVRTELERYYRPQLKRLPAPRDR